MVRIRAELDDSLTKFASKAIQGALEDFCSHSAWAGIKDNPDAAKKARGNHYGEYFIDENGYAVAIPVRQFIWGAIKDIEEGNVGFTADEIKELMVKKINQDPKVRKLEWRSFEYGKRAGVQYRATTQKETPVLKGGNYDKVFEKLAKKMEARLKDAILSVDIVGSDKPRVGGTTTQQFNGHKVDIRENAPSTIKQKGFDHPLIDTWEMFDSIRSGTDA